MDPYRFKFSEDDSLCMFSLLRKLRRSEKEVKKKDIS